MRKINFLFSMVNLKINPFLILFLILNVCFIFNVSGQKYEINRGNFSGPNNITAFDKNEYYAIFTEGTPTRAKIRKYKNGIITNEAPSEFPNVSYGTDLVMDYNTSTFYASMVNTDGTEIHTYKKHYSDTEWSLVSVIGYSIAGKKIQNLKLVFNHNSNQLFMSCALIPDPWAWGAIYRLHRLDTDTWTELSGGTFAEGGSSNQSLTTNGNKVMFSYEGNSSASYRSNLYVYDVSTQLITTFPTYNNSPNRTRYATTAYDPINNDYYMVFGFNLKVIKSPNGGAWEDASTGLPVVTTLNASNCTFITYNELSQRLMVFYTHNPQDLKAYELIGSSWVHVPIPNTPSAINVFASNHYKDIYLVGQHGSNNVTIFSINETPYRNTVDIAPVANNSNCVLTFPTRGVGHKVAVFVKQSATYDAPSPVNGTTYTANTTFGSGSQIGTSGWYCVYNNVGQTVTITGLVAGNKYQVQAFEYNGIASEEMYSPSTILSGNPIWFLAGANWTGASNSDWNTAANWSTNAVPNSATDAAIPVTTNKPIVSSTQECKDVYLYANSSLTIADNGKFKVNGTIYNSGNIIVKSTATGDGSLITNTISGSGTYNIERYLAANKWHLVSSPITNAMSGIFTGIWLRPYDETTNAFGAYITPTNVPLTAGQGYSNWTYNNETRTFSGTINNGTVGPIDLPRTNLGWNLIGNPYPSAIDWDAATGWTKTNVANSVYVWNGSIGQYATYIGGVANNGGSQYIPMGQGFFVQAQAGGGSIAMNNNVRVHNSVAFMKNDDPANIIRIKVATAESSDESVIAIRSGVMDEFDYQFDATKLRGDASAPQLYTQKADTETAICAYSELDKVYGKFVSLEPAQYTEHVLLYTHTLDGNQIPQLYDHVTQTLIYPNVPFTFTPTENDPVHRFEFKEPATTFIRESANGSIMVWESNGTLYIDNLEDEILKEVRVFDMQGKLVYVGNQQRNDVNNLSKGVYVVNVLSSNSLVNIKITIK